MELVKSWLMTSFKFILCCAVEELVGHESAQRGDVCLLVYVDICREKLKYGNAMFTKQEGEGLPHSVLLSLASQPFWWISRVCFSHPSPYLRRFGAPRM